jgi:hypothetical protein
MFNCSVQTAISIIEELLNKTITGDLGTLTSDYDKVLLMVKSALNAFKMASIMIYTYDIECFINYFGGHLKMLRPNK